MQLSANSIFKVSAGIALVIFSVAVLLFSVGRAQAAELLEESTSKIGKYQMTLAATTKGEDVMWTVIIYDTETGRSRTYYEKGGGSFGPSFSISTP